MEKNNCLFCNHNNRVDNLFCTNCGNKLNREEKMKSRLVLLNREGHDSIFELNTKQTFIGRKKTNTIILNDEQISKQHAEISTNNSEYWIKDMESKNGVFINGRKIINKELLFHGCLIKLGSSIFRFESINHN